MKKKITALALVICLLAVAVVGGTMAYFTDTDSAKNTMTIGSVEIKQIEQERDGSPFTQNKPLLPAIYDDHYYVQGSINGYAVDLFEYPNVIDKFISVQNVGKSDAYVRTIVAIESPEGFNDNLYGVLIYDEADTGYVDLGEWVYVVVDGVRYVAIDMTYRSYVAAGTTSGPSFGQLYLNKAADNADVKLLGDECTILAVSQAVQADGFSTPETALDEAFGEVTAANVAEWLKYAGKTVVYDADDLKDAIENGDGEIVLGGDIDLNNGGLIIP